MHIERWWIGVRSHIGGTGGEAGDERWPGVHGALAIALPVRRALLAFCVVRRKECPIRFMDKKRTKETRVTFCTKAVFPLSLFLYLLAVTRQQQWKPKKSGGIFGSHTALSPKGSQGGSNEDNVKTVSQLKLFVLSFIYFKFISSINSKNEPAAQTKKCLITNDNTTTEIKSLVDY